MRTRYFFSLFFVSTFIFSSLQAADTVESPDGTIKATITLENQELTYSVSYNAKEVISKSNLGIKTYVDDFTTGLTYLSSSKSTINENYQLPSGKASSYTNNCNELIVKVVKNAKECHVIFRAYNDGIAFQYSIPGTGSVGITKETSQFAIASFEKCWAMKYANSYEQYFPVRNWTETVAQGKLSSPVLVKSNNDSIFCLLTEAANTGTYTSSTFNGGTQTGLYNLVMNGVVTTTLPLFTPWRVALIGKMPTIVESVTIENLNPATTLTDLSWIKPGRASWDWGGEEGGPTVSNALAEKYIDLASSMGWEYYMQDDGWDKAGFNLPAVISYAATKNVGVLLWSHSNRFTNNETQIRTILSQWKNMGIKGVKVDFWNDDSQTEFKKYDLLLKVAAEQGLLVNVHGCTKPSGLRRTWPNLLTSEGVYGGEQYLFNGNATPAFYNITLSMTRNVIGPMDYTPLDFARKNGSIKQNTSWSHQLALGVVYESGIQHMNDSPENYKYHIAKEFLKKLPTAWDETKCLEAFPDKYVTVARRKGNDWYVASLCDTARTLQVKLPFLSDGVTYQAQIFKDGTCPSDIKYEQKEIRKNDILTMAIPAHGGVTILLTTTPFEQPVFTLFEAEAVGNTMANGAKMETGDDYCSNDAFAGWIGNGASLTMNNVTVSTAGKYNVTLYFMTGDTRSTFIKWNDGPENMYSYEGTGGYEGRNMGMRTYTVDLKSGVNNIKFGNASGWGINVDRVVISPVEKENTGIGKTASSLEILVYPSITTGPVQVHFSKNSPISSIKIVDLNGKILFVNNKIKDTDGSIMPLDFSKFSDGMYLVVANSPNGTSIQKIIKKSL